MAAIIIAAWAVLAWPWLSGRVTVPWDAKAHFQPQLQFLADSLHRGESPFWNPFVFAGSPQIADPQSLIFSPPHLLLAALDPSPDFRAGDAVALAMLLAGALAVAAFFRDRGWHQAGAVVAALSFAFGASAAWRLQHTGQVLSLAWWAIALLCLDRALRRASPAWGALAGLTAGFMVLGRDQVALLGVYLLAGATLWHVLAASDRRRALRAALLPLLCGLASGLVVTAVPLVMTAQLAADSNRPAIDYAGAARGSFPPAGLLTLWSANLFGTDGPLAAFWGPPSLAWGETDLFLARNMSDLYGGAIALVALLSWGIARGGFAAREIRFVLVALIVLLAYALGRYTPAFALLFHLPGVDLFRRPADASFLIGALLAIAAGYAVHRGLTGTLGGRPRPSQPPASDDGAEGGTASPARVGRGRLALAALLVGGGWAACAVLALAKGQFQQAWPALALSGLALAAAALALALSARIAGKRPLMAAGLLAVLMTLDLAWNNGPNESTALPPAMFDVLRPQSANPTIALLRKRLEREGAPDRRDRVELAGIDFHWPNASITHRLDHTLGYNPLRLDHYSRATGAQDSVALPSQREFSPLFPSYRSHLANMLGLRFIVTGVPIGEIDKSLRPGELPLIARTPDGYVYENREALPRVMLVPHAASADFEALIRTGAWPSFDPRLTVLIEQGVPTRPAGQPRQGCDAPQPETPRPPDASAAQAASGAARLRHYGTTEVRVAVTSACGGYVVLNDVWHPWWRAEIDGVEAPLLRANAIFRAVAVPPGTHEVRFVFRPFRGSWDSLKAWLRGHAGA